MNIVRIPFFLNIKKKSKKGIPPKFTLMGPDYYLVGEH